MKATFGYSLEQYNLGKEFVVATDSIKIIEIAQKILNNNLIILNSISGNFIDAQMQYDINNFDWNIQITNSPNSFQMNLQALTMLTILMTAYLVEDNEEASLEYIDRATEFFYSWLNYSNDGILSKGNPYVWNDHAAALRSEAIIFFALVLDKDNLLDNRLKKDITNILYEQGEFLADEKHYVKKHNHGIFQDRSLIYTAFFINDKRSLSWLDISKRRLKEQKDFAFNIENVHVENSPSYHVIVIYLFQQVADFLMQFQDEFAYELNNDLFKASEFMVFMLKPNGKMIEFGDTDGGLGRYLKLSGDRDLFHNPRLTYAATQGKKGIKPSINKAIFKNSGYYIYREHWDEGRSFRDSTWIGFKAGYMSKTHKHSDDLSFTLYTKGHDVFVDPGWYNYMWGDRYRTYLTSAMGHNTIVVDGKSYSATDENSYKTGMLVAKKGDLYDYILGFNDAYQGVKIDRHFYSMGNAILLFDNIKSNEEHSYTQLFHLSQTINLVKHNDQEIVLSIDKTDFFVRIKQLVGGPKFTIHTGDFQKEDYGYISKGFNHIDVTTSLKFEVRGKNCDFVTLITIEDSNGEQLKDLIFDANSKTIKFCKRNVEHTITLEERQRFDITNVSVDLIDRNTFRFVNNSGAPVGTQYAWYLIDRKTKKACHKTIYLNENNYICKMTPSESSSFWLKAYMRNSLFQRKQQIVASIEFDDKSSEYKILKAEQYGLTIREKYFTQISERKFRFIVDYECFSDVRLQWLIYKNGGAKESLYMDNNGILEYEFQEVGSYSVMFYLRTSNGDSEFHILPVIEIN